MKKLFLFSIIALTTTVFLFSCHKDDDTTPAEKNKATLIGTWDANKGINKYKIEGEPVETDTIVFTAGSYVKFDKDRNYYTRIVSENAVSRDTGFYKIDDKNVYITYLDDKSTDTFQIKKLDESVLELYGKSINGNRNYSETYLFLSK